MAEIRERARRAPELPRALELDRRSAGLLLHITSLPGPHGNGDMGPAARRFIDFLQAAGQRWWQMLPVNPPGRGNSPYSGASAFAGNPLLVSLQDLVEDGLLSRGDVKFRLGSARVDYANATTRRAAALRKAFESHRRNPARLRGPLEQFRRAAVFWLPDYTLYMALNGAMPGVSWTKWPRGLAKRAPHDLMLARRRLAAEMAYFEFEQFLFQRQWARLRRYAQTRGVGLIGDAPIFIAHQSADVWAGARFFTLDLRGEPTHVAGVPPDYFSKTGQRWGNPLYRWNVLARQGHLWWIERFRTLLAHFDIVRLDHFIGFTRYWEVPASESTAERGAWRKGPGHRLFEVVRKRLGSTPFIAEDLGEITPEVRSVRDASDLPGMRVLQFAFGSDLQANDFLPHRYVSRTVAYTGTHDNDTFLGWFEDRGGKGRPRSVQQAAKERRAAIRYLAGPEARQLPAEPCWEAIRAIYASVADTAIVPMQDALGLGNEARMNTPGQSEGNWEWRVPHGDLSSRLAARLRRLAATYGRLPPTTGKAASEAEQ